MLRLLTGTVFFLIIFRIIENIFLKFEIKLNEQQKNSIINGILFLCVSGIMFFFLERVFSSPWFTHSLSRVLLQQ